MVRVGCLYRRQDEVFKGHGHDGVAAHPTVGQDPHKVLRGQWFADRDGHLQHPNLVFLRLPPFALAGHHKLLTMINVLTIAVFNPKQTRCK